MHVPKNTETPPPKQRGIQSIEIGALVLEAIEEAGGPASLSRLTAIAEMQPSKVHRYLVSLVRCGLVSQSEETGLYDFGPAARRIGTEAIRRLDEGNVAGPHAVALRDKLGYSVNLTAWGEAGPTVIRWEYGRFPMHVTVRAGGTLPLWSSAGRVFLAHLPRLITRRVFVAQKGIGTPANAELSDLDEELELIRQTGLSMVSDTPVLGVDGFAAPILDADGKIVLVLGIVAPRTVMTAKRRTVIGDGLREAASVISSDLGKRP